MGKITINPYRFAGVSYDSDAQTYFSAITTNSGTISAGTKTALNAFVLDAKNNADAWWTAMTFLWIALGDQWAAASVVLKHTVGSSILTSAGTGSYGDGDYSEAVGVTGRALTALDTGVNALSHLSLNDVHCAFDDRSAAASGDMRIACNDGSDHVLNAVISNTAYSDFWSNSGRASASITSAAPGFIVGSRTSSSVHKLYKNAVEKASVTTQTAARPNISIYVLGDNSNGTPANFSSGEKISSLSFGTGLTAAQVTAYNSALSTLRTAISRG